MSTSEITITESVTKMPDGARLYTIDWYPPQVKAAVLLVHGMGEHCRRYDHVGQAFAKAGIALTGFDLRGHGRSEGKRGHIPGIKKAMDDIDHFLARSAKKSPGVPLFLYGHSMGGMIALNHSLTRHPDITGVICTAPGLKPGQPVQRWKIIVGNLLYSLVPSFTMDNGLDVNNLSCDRNVVEAYKQDPLVTPMISAEMGLDIINTGPWIEEHGEDFTHPLLLMQGLADHVVSPSSTRRFASRVPQNLITYREFPEMCHELHNEPQQNEVLEEMINWIRSKVN